MLDNSDKNGHAETMIDYVVSWCLRCSCHLYTKECQPILYHYCKYMLCKLLGKVHEMDNLTIDDVHVWKQEQYIDLWVEVVLLVDKKKEKHAILIENKYFTGVHDDQLKRYKSTFIDYYGNRSDEFPKDNLHYVLITCIYDVDSHYEALATAAKAADFGIYHLYELLDDSLCNKASESDIFNELFIREWL